MSGNCGRCGASLPAGVGRCGKCGAPRAPSAETASRWGGLDVKPPGGAGRAGAELGTAATMISRPAAPPTGLPDLIPPQPPPRPAAPPPPGRGLGGLGGFGGDDDLVVLSNSAALDLGMGSAAAPSAPRAPGAALELDAPVAKKVRSRKDDPEEFKREQYERVQKLADFGPVGANALEVAQYAVRVMTRRRALGAELVALRTERDAAEQAMHAAQEALGEAIFDKRAEPRLQPVVRELRAAAEAMVALDDTRSAGADAEAQAQTKVEGFAKQMAELEQQLSPVREREKRLLASINQLDQQKARLQALDKRAQIELRALAQAQNADPARATTLQAEQRARAGELASLDVQLQPFSDELGEVRRELAKHAGTIAALQEDRKAAVRAAGELKKQHSATAGDAHKQQRRALRVLALAVVERNLAGLEPDLVERANAAEEALDARDKAVKLHETALESFESGAFNRGRMVLVGAVLALLAAVIALLAR